MRFEDFVPFIFFLIFIGLSVLRGILERGKGDDERKPSIESQQRQEAVLKQLLQAMDMEPEEEKARRKPPPPPRPAGVRKAIAGDFGFDSKLEDHTLDSAIESRSLKLGVTEQSGDSLVSSRLQALGDDEAYAQRARRGNSRAANLLRGGSLRDAIILKEVLGTPLADRDV